MYRMHMEHVKHIISELGGNQIVAEYTCNKVGTVRQWGNRNSIPKGEWPRLVGLAEQRKAPVSYETLAQIHCREVAA